MSTGELWSFSVILLLFSVVAVRVGAHQGTASLHEKASALGAFLLYRLVSVDLIAGRVVAAAVEGLALSAAFYYYFRAALRAFYAC